ncbi:MAG: C40 family peptidase, partial [Clostridium sp.]|uniref:C40 family peptidase n=1 Tax=Clostridium sp. TaxID=1506 RepID=UPI003F3CA53F
YIPARYQGGATTDLQQKVVQSARKLIGKPYVWGGNYPPLGNSNGTDCSGLMQWAYNDIGKGDVIPGRWTTETMINYGKEISQSNIQLGDCIITPGHVVMYSGIKDGKHQIVEAPRTGLNIRERDYTFPSNVTGIRRYL